MKIKLEYPSDESDKALDRAIQAAKTEPYPPELKNRVLQKAASISLKYRSAPRFTRRWSWPILASAVPAIIAAGIIVFLLLPSPTIGWEETIKTVNAQKWIRATANTNKGVATKWFSPEQKIWAYCWPNNHYVFFDGRNQVKYEYSRGLNQYYHNKIVKLPLRDQELQQFVPVDYRQQIPWIDGYNAVRTQKRREITEAGKKWIEFDITYTIGRSMATLRVDPESRLPVSLAVYDRDSGEKINEFIYDYPSDGPKDIYALGAPADMKIDDQMSSDDCMKVLRAMAASRAKIGDFRLVVVVDPFNYGVSSIVWRKGDKWRIDLCESENMLPLQMRGVKPPDGLGWGDPAAQRLKLSWVRQNLICDGRMVYKNINRGELSRKNNPEAKGPQIVDWKPAGISPQELLSGEGEPGYIDLAPYAKIASLLYPDLTPRLGWGFEFDPHPADAPGCVLIKQSAHLSTGEVGHEWYYIDPAKGCAVVGIKRFNLPADVPANPDTAAHWDSFKMEEFQQSPQGFWYPKIMRYENISRAKDQNQKNGTDISSRSTTAHYHFDFDADMPDSLFEVNLASDAKK